MYNMYTPNIYTNNYMHTIYINKCIYIFIYIYIYTYLHVYIFIRYLLNKMFTLFLLIAT